MCFCTIVKHFLNKKDRQKHHYYEYCVFFLIIVFEDLNNKDNNTDKMHSLMYLSYVLYARRPAAI